MNLKKVNIKLILIIVTIIIAIICGMIFVLKDSKDKVVKNMEEEPYNYFVLYSKNGKIGVVDKSGNIIINPEYQEIYIPNQSKDVFICYETEDNYSILNSNGNKIFTDYSSVTPIIISDISLDMEKKVLCYEENGKFGLLNYSGKKLTNAIYENILSLVSKPGCILVKKDGLYGVLDSEGNTIIDVKYNSIKGDAYVSEKDGYMETGYIVSEKTNTGINYGYIDYNGKVLIEPKYESITRVLEYDEDDIYLIYMENGKKGVIKNKKKIIDSNYRTINYYNQSNIFVVNRNGKYGFLDNNGKEILPTEYTNYSIAGDYISVKKDDSMSLYDLHGNLLNKDGYKSISETGNPSFFIAQDDNGYYSIISKDSKLENNYTNITYAFDNFYIFTDEQNLTGVLDVYSGIEIEPQYDYIIMLENSKALEARKGNKVDIYSQTIEKVLSMTDGIVQKVNDDYTSIYSNNDLVYLDKTGNIVANTEVFKDIELYSKKAEDGKWGFVDKAGNIVIECKYDRVTELNEYGFAGICLNKKWGVIDKVGNVIVEPSYELDVYYSPSFLGKYVIDIVDGMLNLKEQ